jgi:ketosteroid isomerase-like protein
MQIMASSRRTTESRPVVGEPEIQQMNDMQQIAATFHAAINGRSLDALHALMTADHVFIDVAGNPINGRDA